MKDRRDSFSSVVLWSLAISVSGLAACGGGGANGSHGEASSDASTTTGGSQGSGGTLGSGGDASGSTSGSAGGGASGTGGAGGSGGASAAPVFHLFLLLGQSNMAGYPKPLEVDKEEEPRIKVLAYEDCDKVAPARKKDQWYTASPPLHECWWGALGPGDYFAKTLIKKLPAGDTIGLIPAAISGEKIETFMKAGGSKYDWILNKAKLGQQAGGVIEGILFHQGESNNGDPSWPGKVNTLVTDLRKDLGTGDVPFLAGELLYSGACAGHNTQVNKLPTTVTNAHVISAEGLVVDPTDTMYKLHFSRDSVVTQGTRYAEKYMSLKEL